MTLLIIIAAYLVGSIPVAYLVTHRATGKDLRREGSGNIGTRNAFEVTNSKKIGILVLVLDLFKGLLPIVLLSELGYSEHIPVAIIALILGHCYPIWLRFHGGRGLAPSAGVMLLAQPFALIIWLQSYLLLSVLKRNVHLNAAISTVLSGIMIAFLPSDYFYTPIVISPDTIDSILSLRMSLLIIHSLILIKHLSPIYTILRAKNQ